MQTQPQSLNLSVYLASPLYTSGDLVSNVRAAIEAAQQLESVQHPRFVLRPFVAHFTVLTWQLVYPRHHELAQEWDDHWLRKCDAVWRLPGYSIGADHEVTLALSLRMPVLYKFEEVLAWANQQTQAG